MAVITCSYCNRVASQSLDIDMCFNCIHMGGDDTKIAAIKKYLAKHPGSQFQDVARELRIGISDVNRYIDEGILIVKKNENGEVFNEEKIEKRDLRREQFLKNYTAAMEPRKITKVEPGKKVVISETDSKLVKDLKTKKGIGDR